MKAIHLKCNDFLNPVQVEENPLFSWNIPCNRNGAGQTAYRIQVYQGKETDNIWDTGRTEGNRCLYIPYEGQALMADSQYFWRVKYWNEKGGEEEWSEPAYFETGLMGKRAGRLNGSVMIEMTVRLMILLFHFIVQTILTRESTNIIFRLLLI